MNLTPRLRDSLLYIAIAGLAACSSSSSSRSIGTGGTTTLTIGGSVTGLVSGTSVVLADNAGTATITANGNYSFTATFNSGASYDVTVSQQPAGGNCMVTNGSGTLGTGNVTNILVACTPNNYTISGTVAGMLGGRSLTLQDNGGNSTTVAASGGFSFSSPVASGSNYAVTIMAQPAGQTCSVTNGSGIVAAADITDVSINCSDNTYNVGVTVTGLGAGSLVLQNNGADNLTVAASGMFNFNTAVASGSNYAVTVLTQPAGQTCAVSNGSGTIVGANISNVTVACSDNTYKIGVTVSGLSAGGLVLQDNGVDNLSIGANGSVNFATSLVSGSSYAVTVLTQPTQQICTVTAGSGTVANTNVAGIAVSCTSTYTIGGTVSGLVSGGLVLQDNGADDLTISADGSFTFATAIAAGGAYAVTILTQPTGQTCSVSNGAGSVGAANIGNIAVSCGNVWTWVGGSNAISTAGIYGTQGIASASNVPGARLAAISWTDLSGNLWLFGGNGDDSSGTSGNLNDLWKFDPVAGTWDWVGGSNAIGAAGVYGTQGLGAVGNAPGARDAAMSWSDSSGNLWLFGGNGLAASGAGFLNDLWIFNPTAGTWEWVSGSNSTDAGGVYGTQGVASTSNMPGGRIAAVSWTDSSGNLWLFGGFGYDSANNLGDLNDLWEFNPTAGTWEWVSGSNTISANGVYGTQGVASINNVPGARSSAVSWRDLSGNLWLFGGNGYDSSGVNSDLNDLWELNPATGTWVWISGSNSANASGAYGTQGIASASNVPGSRNSSTSWSDSSGNLWLFGGSGYFNDLWKFNTTAGTWEWVSGSNTNNVGGVYGTQGAASISTMPGSRATAVSWTDSSGNLWLFGGNGYDSTNNLGDLGDLWKYTP
ncbi:MAG TPA: kelch repeat-containing protein [Steroidobacteraceae bacterium]|nr:kelch repeat-containing protein [Steroidobacteraceae bacterium]